MLYHDKKKTKEQITSLILICRDGKEGMTDFVKCYLACVKNGGTKKYTYMYVQYISNLIHKQMGESDLI